MYNFPCLLQGPGLTTEQKPAEHGITGNKLQRLNCNFISLPKN